MKINDKLNLFIAAKNIPQAEIAEKNGISQQYVSQIINGQRKVPLSMIINMKRSYPDLDINSLLSQYDGVPMVAEDRSGYGDKAKIKAEILAEIGVILDKYLGS